MQYDLLLTQNTHATGVEWSEKLVNLAKGSLLTSGATGALGSLAIGADGTILVPDAASALGMKYVAINTLVTANNHVQGTDLGTTNTVFGVDTDGFDIELTAESASKFGVKVSGGATYADMQAKDIIANKVTLPSTDPAGAYDAVHKTYVDNKFGTLAGALLFKGNILTTGGDVTPTAFNALATYTVGWQYRAAEAGTFKGFVCEVGDLLTAMVTRAGSGNVNGDWTVSQTNIDGAVTGPASATDHNLAQFNGATGKLIEDSGLALSTVTTAITTANNAIPKSVFTATGNEIILGSGASTYAALTLGASTIFGRGAAGNAAALTPAQARTILNVADGATNNTKASAAEINAGTDDAKFATAVSIKDSTIVKGPSSSVANRLALFGDISGKLLADSGKTLSDLMATWVTAPASKTSTGVVGQLAYDANYFYVCTATNTWKRNVISTNW